MTFVERYMGGVNASQFVCYLIVLCSQNLRPFSVYFDTYRSKCLPCNFIVALHWLAEVVLQLPELVIQVVVDRNRPERRLRLQMNDLKQPRELVVQVVVDRNRPE